MKERGHAHGERRHWAFGATLRPHTLKCGQSASRYSPNETLWNIGRDSRFTPP
jgi:hypothetical protein